MKTMRTVSLLLSTVLVVLGAVGCEPQTVQVPKAKSKADQELPITFGGFLKDGPEAETLNGVCGTDTTRNVLNCDIHNGIPAWTITEITLAVPWAPYNDSDKNYYRIPVSIAPLTTQSITTKLGTALPKDDVVNIGKRVRTLTHWSWLIAGAKGRPAS
jgi:hypothetical protein